MRKFYLPIFIIASISLVGCQESDNRSHPAAPDEKAPVSISVVTSYGGDDGNRLNYENAFKAYEATSGNIVRDSSAISNEEWKSSIMESFANGTEPDVLFFFTGADSNKLIEDNKLVSIDEIRSVYPEYAANMKDDMIPPSPVDGKIYAVPVNGYWEGLYVNKKVLKDCDVKIPDENTTWEQFLADCQKIADKGYTPIAASLNEVPHYWFEFCILNNGSVESHPLIPESASDDIGKNWSAGLKDIKALYDKGFFPKDTLTANSAEMDALITNDKAAFMIDGSWKMGWFAENASDINNFTVTYVPGKGERKPTDIIGGISMGYFITQKAWNDPKKQAACVEFISAMTTDEVVATFGSTAITALKENMPLSSNTSNLVKDAHYMTSNFTNIVSAAGDGLLPNSRSDLFANIKNIATGDTTPEKAIAQSLAIRN